MNEQERISIYVERIMQRDTEIAILTRQNQALREKLDLVYDKLAVEQDNLRIARGMIGNLNRNCKRLRRDLTDHIVANSAK